jgi:hypothetical protein
VRPRPRPPARSRAFSRSAAALVQGRLVFPPLPTALLFAALFVALRVSVCAGLSDAAYATGFAGGLLGYGKPRPRSRPRARAHACARTRARPPFLRSHAFLRAPAAAYDSLHFAIHHAHPLALERALGPLAWPAAEAFRALQRRHLAHHRVGTRNFGVSSPLWDVVLGTALSSAAELKLRCDGDDSGDHRHAGCGGVVDGEGDSEGGGEDGGECGAASDAASDAADSPDDAALDVTGERHTPSLGVLVPAARVRHAVVAP